MPPKRKSKNPPLLKCKDCDYTTQRKAFMADHVRIHTGDRPYKCQECGKGFTQKSNLTKHMIVHGEGYKTEYKCDRCDFTTRYKQSLKMHENWHNGVKPYVCKECGRSFSQSTHRRTHMKEAHGDERKFQCDLCSKCFKRREHLDKHIAFHRNERNYACKVCGKTFIDEKHVTIHMLIHGGEETKVHKCDLCPYKSRYKQGLEVHYRIHLGVRPYKCDQCTKAFRTSQTLRIHCRMVHQGLLGKIFHCDKCDYRTANKQTLKKHIQTIHMGIKVPSVKFPCPYCGNIYLGHSSLHGHKRKKHPQKLRQELRTKLQQRLAMIRSPEGKLHAKAESGTTEAMEDYRFKHPLHSSMLGNMVNKLHSGGKQNNDEGDKESTPKKPRRPKLSSGKDQANMSRKRKSDGDACSIQVKKSPGDKRKQIQEKTAVSPKSKTKVQSPKKEPVTPAKSPLVKTSISSAKQGKKPVHDLIQERLAKKNKLSQMQKSKAVKKIDFSKTVSSTGSDVNEERYNTATERSGSNSDISSKLSYMTDLGLLQRKETVSETRNVVPVAATANSSADKELNFDGVPIVHLKQLGIITNFEENDGVEEETNIVKTQTTKKTPKKSPKGFPKIKAMKSPKEASKVSKKTPKVTKSPPSPKVVKQKASPKKTTKKTISEVPVSQPVVGGPAMIVYEPVDVPSLGPYTDQCVGTNPSRIVHISPEPGLMAVTEIKQEKEDIISPAVGGAASVEYVKQYDSLRALASVFLTDNSGSA